MRYWLILAAALALGIADTAPVRADQTDPRLDSLFVRLKAAVSADEARWLEDAIWQLWSEPKTAGGRVLMRDGLAAMEAELYDAALESFDALVAIEPDFAEAWNRRATARYLAGDFNGSVADIQHVLALEPRHFGALSGLGLIYDALDEKPAAIKAFRAALEIDPHMEAIRARLDQLVKEVEGTPL